MTLAARVTGLAELMYGCNAQEVKVGAVGQEKFCRLVAAGHNYEKAYAQAYDLDSTRKGCAQEALRLSRSPHIIARIMQIRTQGIKGYTVQREDLLEPLLWAVNTARERGSTAEVRKSIEAIGKLFGLVVDKIEANVIGQFTVMKDVQLDGSNLVFDIGSGHAVTIKGERVDGTEPTPALHDNRAVIKPDDTLGTLQGEGGTHPLDALQNAFKTLPTQPIELDTQALPVEATLDVVGDEGGGSHVVSKPKGRKPRAIATSREALRTLQDAAAEDEAYCGEDML